ncbi:hypothetical protein Atep_11500 [Allochromatium tepidum]|uniref:Uncharacterized protein n=1 Tax=Allochromatium tepidum TaxID=553982 RepID=A0ABN6G998_9GAMM|nr:hypothetical protein Atep_11500 [Allochromatium tepidum]
MVLAVVFQHSPLVLVARQDLATPGTQGIHDLVGKRVMIEPRLDDDRVLAGDHAERLANSSRIFFSKRVA